MLPVVPMFHVNAWGYPYVAAMIGAKLVFPGPHLDPESLLDDFSQEHVTWTAGVPTIWLRDAADCSTTNPGRWDLSSLRAHARRRRGGPACDDQGLQGAPRDRRRPGLGHDRDIAGRLDSRLRGRPRATADDETKYDFAAMAGLPLPFVEVRARVDDEEVPWDGETMGELEVRGPWIASSYYELSRAGADRWTDDGWFKTGDIVAIHPRGFIQIKDRTKDVIKSGGEWISSVELENALMAHPAVAEAAVIAIPDPEWQERPLAVVVLEAGLYGDGRGTA